LHTFFYDNFFSRQNNRSQCKFGYMQLNKKKLNLLSLGAAFYVHSSTNCLLQFFSLHNILWYLGVFQNGTKNILYIINGSNKKICELEMICLGSSYSCGTRVINKILFVFPQICVQAMWNDNAVKVLAYVRQSHLRKV